MNKKKTTSDALEIIDREFYRGKPQRIAAALDRRVEIRFVPARAA